MRYFTTIFWGLLVICSCKSTEKNDDRTELYQTSYTGYNVKAEAEVCYPEDNLNCSARSEDQNKFLSDCKGFGYEAFECSCELVLCSYNIAKASLGKQKNPVFSFTGYDYKGKRRSCRPMAKDVFCTMSVEPADEYALECKARGHESVQCACHDHLCSERIDSF